jgi:sigma-70-like protein
MNASIIVNFLLGQDDLIAQILGEASIHRPQRGTKWVASYTGPDGGQVWRTTGTSDCSQATAIAQEFEAAARAQRAKSNFERKKALVHPGGAAAGGLTQAEVGRLLGLSARAVRAIERRALRKLSRHPQLKDMWRQHRTGELAEDNSPLCSIEKIALLGLTRNQAECRALRQALAAISNN